MPLHVDPCSRLAGKRRASPGIVAGVIDAYHAQQTRVQIMGRAPTLLSECLALLAHDLNRSFDESPIHLGRKKSQRDPGLRGSGKLFRIGPYPYQGAMS